ncbi:MAG TPA: YaaC family protein, partial [Bacillaceae bacterium]
MHLNYFQSASTTRRFLRNCYEQQDLPERELKSYDNCYPFMYYLEQGELYYTQATFSPLSIKPVLLFYGMIHLLKACLLTVDPVYPGTTSVLAHGVTTRKRKKQQYQFFNDEVKVQKNGLCTHFAERMFHVKQLEGEKFKMGPLLELIPELSDLFLFATGSGKMHFLEEAGKNRWLIPSVAAESYYMDDSRLKEYLNEKHIGPIPWVDGSLPGLAVDSSVSPLKPPFRFDFISGR